MKQRLVWQAVLGLVLLVATAPVVWAQAPDGGDQVVIGRDFVLPANEQIDGSLAVIGGTATLEAGSVVRGDVALFGSSATVAGTVMGNLVVVGGSIVLEDSAVVEGDLATFGGSVSRAPGAVVSGEVFGSDIPLPLSFLRQLELSPIPDRPWQLMPAAERASGGGVFGALGSFLVWQLRTLAWALFLALLGVVLVALAPRATGRIASAAAGTPLVSFGMGLLTLIVGLLLGLLLLIACCSGLVVWLVLGAAWLIGWLAVGLWLGQRLLQGLNVRNATAIGEVALGVFLITVLTQLPACIGFFTSLILGCTGLGAVVLTRFGARSLEDGGNGVSTGPAESAAQGEIGAPGDAGDHPALAAPPEQPAPEPLADSGAPGAAAPASDPTQPAD
jgi:hypothetical protein